MRLGKFDLLQLELFHFLLSNLQYSLLGLIVTPNLSLLPIYPFLKIKKIPRSPPNKKMIYLCLILIFSIVFLSALSCPKDFRQVRIRDYLCLNACTRVECLNDPAVRYLPIQPVSSHPFLFPPSLLHIFCIAHLLHSWVYLVLLT